MTRALANSVLLRCYDLCEQAKSQGISSVEQFNAWLDKVEEEFAKKHKYVDEDHNVTVRKTCQKLFFLVLRKVKGFENRQVFQSHVTKVQI